MKGSAIVPVLTLILWVGCLAVGIVGWARPYLRPHAPAPAPPSLTAELLNVELISDPLPLNPGTPPPPFLPPPLVPVASVAPAPPMISVAAPSPQIAFAVPIDAPAVVVPPREASYRTVETPSVQPAPPAPQALTFGQGEGKQPAPDYPRQALRLGQEGVVTVRMTVGPDGRVAAAEVWSPAPWPLLNEAALRVVKTRWRFASGPIRAYEVAIRFELNK